MSPRPRKPKPRPVSIIPLEQALPEVPDRNAHERPTQHLVKDGEGSYTVENIRRPSKTLLADRIRDEVDAWRDSGYLRPKGISDTSRRLLEWWFEEEHFEQGGEPFHFYFAQREAIETLIYLYEVRRVRDNAILAETFMDPQTYETSLFADRKKVIQTAKNERILERVVPETGQLARQELPPADLSRYAIKMATGSGKTLVMAMVAVWSYFHKKNESESSLAKAFLLLAPNVIVFERLRLDFENGIIFTKYPLIPPEWFHDWQMTCILRGESRKSSTPGTIYLTNIQQLYERDERGEEINPVARLLGSKPKGETGSWEESIFDRVKRHPDLLVMNDEAHHVHETDLKWYEVIMTLHENLKKKGGQGLVMDLDFSATPKDQNGTYYAWIICDYPLAQAVEDRIVKLPLIVHQTEKQDPEKYSKASVAYAEWINIAISRWKEHDKAYGGVGKRPVLFIMAENTKDADDIEEALKTKSEFKSKGQVLLIHTDKTGEITKGELEKARTSARSIDLPSNKIRAIVSVMMLREGWDVQGVSVVLGLRPFTSKANILPEQAVGRGLRLMRGIGPEYTQIVELVGTKAFEEFVQGLEVEGVGVGRTVKPPNPGENIYPMKERIGYDIELPVLTPSRSRNFEGLKDFDVKSLPSNPQKVAIPAGIDGKVKLVETVTQKTVGVKQVTIDTGFPMSQEILSHLSDRVMRESGLKGHFAEIYPLVKSYVQEAFFGKAVDLEADVIRRLLSDSANASVIVATLAKALGSKCVVRTEVKLESQPILLSETEPFLWKRDLVACEHTIFNKTPCFNPFEKHFAQFLNQASDIRAFAKLAETYTRFSISYLSTRGALRFYHPDFVAVQEAKKGLAMWLIETKGQEYEDVPLKDARAVEWCHQAASLTKISWEYLKVPYLPYSSLSTQFTRFPSKQFSEFVTLLKTQTGTLGVK